MSINQLHLLNLLLRGVDSLAQMGLSSLAPQDEPAIGGGGDANITGAPASASSSQFASLRSQFEYTFESLRQLFGSCHRDSWQLSGGALAGAYSASASAPAPAPAPASAAEDTFSSATELGRLFAASKPADQRSLMLVIALHRRLLDQLARMRMELPPVCRLAAAASPLNRPSPRHRALAEMEDKLHCLVSRHSLKKLAPILTDPLLKLDEFLLLYELIGDLFAFVGQKCRQNFLQRGKQLLNELTPVTGCPSSSSSDDDEDSLENNCKYFVQADQQQQQQLFDTCAQGPRNSGILLGSSRETLNNLALISSSHHQLAELNQPFGANMNHSAGGGGGGGNRRFSEYPESAANQLSSMAAAAASSMSPSPSSSSRQHRASAGDYLLQQPQFTTRISITAPSPMGSLRDINNNTNSYHHHSGGKNQQQQQRQQPQQFGAVNKSGRFSARQQNDLCDRTSELNLRGCGESATDEAASDARIEANEHEDQEAGGHERSRSASDQGVDKTASDKSRSQLIDELLRSINDDSFTADYVDFQGNFHQGTGGGQQQHRAATATSSALVNPSSGGGGGGGGGGGNYNSAGMNRPRSAMDSTTVSSANNSNNQQQQQQRRQSTNRPLRPNQTPQTSSTFDNVIRRMSTNLVQNFNKMSGSSAPQSSNEDSSATYITTTTTPTPTMASASATNVRREKSSNYANSLYVDNQVPARRHSDNTINIPRIQVALSSPQAGNSRFGLNQRASVSASKLANKWKLSAKTNQREASDKLSPNLGGALGYMRRHSSGNTTGNDQSQSNGQTSSANLLLNASPFKTKSSSNLGLDFLLSNRSMKRRYSAASMLGHQTQRKAENLIDAGMKSVVSRSSTTATTITMGPLTPAMLLLTSIP